MALVLNELISDRLFDVRCRGSQPRNPVDDVPDKMEAVDPIAHDHVERRRRRSLLDVTANMKIGMVTAPIGKPVN